MSDFDGSYWFDTMVKPAMPPENAKDGDKEVQKTAPAPDPEEKQTASLTAQPYHLTRGDF